ncbi:hypothetical protein HDU67_004832, partial [Dinochytrium kinnereticum]
TVIHNFTEATLFEVVKSEKTKEKTKERNVIKPVSLTNGTPPQKNTKVAIEKSFTPKPPGTQSRSATRKSEAKKLVKEKAALEDDYAQQAKAEMDALVSIAAEKENSKMRIEEKRLEEDARRLNREEQFLQQQALQEFKWKLEMEAQREEREHRRSIEREERDLKRQIEKEERDRRWMEEKEDRERRRMEEREEKEKLRHEEKEEKERRRQEEKEERDARDELRERRREESLLRREELIRDQRQREDRQRRIEEQEEQEIREDRRAKKQMERGQMIQG